MSVASATSENTDEKFEKFKVQPKNRKAEAVRRVPFVFLCHAAVYHTRDIVEVDEKKKCYEQNHYGGNDHREPAIAVEKIIHGRHEKRNEEHDELNKTNGNKRGSHKRAESVSDLYDSERVKRYHYGERYKRGQKRDKHHPAVRRVAYRRNHADQDPFAQTVQRAGYFDGVAAERRYYSEYERARAAESDHKIQRGRWREIKQKNIRYHRRGKSHSAEEQRFKRNAAI